MRKVLIITYYEIKEHFVSIANNFRTLYNWSVINYPLYMYCYDSLSKVDNITEHFIDYLTEEKPHIILWWFSDIYTDFFMKIKNAFPNIYYVLYCLDDPNKVNFTKSIMFNHLITTDENSIDKYYNKYIDHCLFCYDEMFFKNVKKEYVVDILYICETINNDINELQIIKILNNYCIENKLILEIYGTPLINEISEFYKGNVIYNDLPSLFNTSKIVITNKFSNWITSIKTCNTVLIDDYNKNNIIYKIESSYHNDNSELIKANNLSVKNCSWKKLTDIIFLRYNEFAFNKQKYKNTYSYWLEQWNNNIYEIPYDIEIPNNFDSDNYIVKNNLTDMTLENVYIHWLKHSNDITYMKKNKVLLKDASIYNTIQSSIYDVYSVFNKIYVSNDIDNGLIELNNIISNHKSLKINQLLELYLYN